jgi:hypothetical protein
MTYITPTEAGIKTGLTRAYICRLAAAGRIEGAFRIGRSWAIPSTWTPQPLKRGRPRK